MGVPVTKKNLSVINQTIRTYLHILGIWSSVRNQNSTAHARSSCIWRKCRAFAETCFWVFSVDFEWWMFLSSERRVAACCRAEASSTMGWGYLCHGCECHDLKFWTVQSHCQANTPVGLGQSLFNGVMPLNGINSVVSLHWHGYNECQVLNPQIESLNAGQCRHGNCKWCTATLITMARIRKFSQPVARNARMHASTSGNPVFPVFHFSKKEGLNDWVSKSRIIGCNDKNSNWGSSSSFWIKWQCHRRRPKNDRSALCHSFFSGPRGMVWMACWRLLAIWNTCRIEMVPNAKCGDNRACIERSHWRRHQV